MVLAAALLITALFMNGEALGLTADDRVTMEYESTLFDTSVVHTIDIRMDEDEWQSFLQTATSEEYTACDVDIDGTVYSNVAIRAKGNTSLSSVAQYNSERYSFKIEFDHYQDGMNCDGLDKLVLNNIIQDNTYMKDYLVYQMMNYIGADSPLCSFIWVSVNGEDFGLYLAVEAVEDSFIERVCGEYADGELYKPDSAEMGGGRGNGADFNMEDAGDFAAQPDTDAAQQSQMTPPDMSDAAAQQSQMTPPDMSDAAAQQSQMTPPDMSDAAAQADTAPPDMSGADNAPQAADGGNAQNMGGMSSDAVALVYTDDDYDSYADIFDNAKTDITDANRDRLIASIKQLNEGTDLDEVVDIEEVLKYFVVHNFSVNFDSYTGTMVHNYYLYEEDGVLSMIAWDYNLAFGTFSGGDASEYVNYPIDTPVAGADNSSRPLVGSLFADEEYLELYHEYFAEFLSDYFDSGTFEQTIDSTLELIAPYVEKDPTAFCTYAEFTAGVQELKEFCLLRAESVSGQLDGTIPATSDKQSADSSAFIDAAAVDISAMGTMNAEMQGTAAGGENGDSAAQAAGQGQLPDAQTQPQVGFTPPDGATPPGQ